MTNDWSRYQRLQPKPGVESSRNPAGDRRILALDFNCHSASRPIRSRRNRSKSFPTKLLSGPVQNLTETVQNRTERLNKTGFLLFRGAIDWLAAV